MKDAQKNRDAAPRDPAWEALRSRGRAALGWLVRVPMKVRIGVLFAAGCLAALMWMNREHPARLFREANEIAAKDPSGADRLLEQCLAARPDYPEAQLLRCRVLGSLGFWDEAYGMFHLIKRPELLPGPALLEFALQAHSAGQLAVSQLAADAARKPGPAMIPATQLALQIAVQQGETDRVFELGRELTTLTPDDPQPWRIMADHDQGLKNFPQAAEAYRAALERETDVRRQHALRLPLARVLLESGDIAGALETIQPLLALPEPSAEALLLEAAVLRFEGRTAEALQAVQRILDSHPQFVGAIFLRGILYFDAGEFPAARDDLAKVIRLDPNQKEAHFKLGQTYQRLGDTDRARVELTISRELTEAAAKRGRLQYQTSRGASDESGREPAQTLSKP